MHQKPFKLLLHRELVVADAETHYSRQFALLRDVVNYGTTLIPACFASSDRSHGEIIVIGVLLKQIVMMLDAFEVLARSGCAPAAALQVRAALESSLYIDWMLQSDADKKARYYHVSNVRKERQWVERMASKAEREKFTSELGDFADTMRVSLEDGEAATSARERLVSIDEFLQRKDNKEINESFEQLKALRKYEVAWHVPLGASSVRQIAKLVNRLAEYEAFYVYGSEAMHAARHNTHLSIQGGKITFEHIRHLEGLATSMNSIVGVAFHSYRAVLTKYRPGQLGDFNRCYVEDWREAFMNMTKVVYRAEMKVI